MPARLSCFTLAVLLICSWPTRGRAADPPPDDRAAQKALRDLGKGSLEWNKAGNVTKASFVGKAMGDAELAPLEKLHSLAMLDLRGTNITDATLKRLEGHAWLHNLDVSGTRISDAGIAHLRKLPSLQYLTLGGTAIGDEGAKELAEIGTLKSLDLRGTKVTGAGLVHLKKLRKLETLELARTPDQSVSLIPTQKPGEPATFKVEPNIKRPPAGAPSITDADLTHILEVKSIKWLDLSGTQLTDVGIAQLAALPNLERIFLDETAITDAGMKHLAAMPRLISIWVQKTAVTDQGLAELKESQTLEWLVATDTRITNVGLMHLQGMPKLNSVSLKGTKVDEPGAKRFRKACPKVVLDYDFPGITKKEIEENDAAGEFLELVEAGDLPAVNAALAKNPKLVNARYESWSKGGRDREPALHEAAKLGNLPMVELLLAHKANVKAVNNWGNTPLGEAATADVAKALIRAGANPKGEANSRSTPLHQARNSEVAEVLLENGADVNARDKPFDLFASTAGQRVRKGIRGKTPLISAASDGRLDVVKLLLARGADVNAADSESTALYWAAWYCRAEIAEVLLAHGANVEGVGGDNPLKCSLKRLALERRNDGSQARLIALLLKSGAKLQETDQFGYTMLHTAVEWGCDADVVGLLIKAGIRVNAKTVEHEPQSFSSSTPPEERPPVTGHRTALHFAAEDGSLELVKALIAHGADIHAKTTDGQTALSLSSRMETFEFNPWVQGTRDSVQAFNDHHRKELEQRNANRKAIAELLRKAGAK